MGAIAPLSVLLMGLVGLVVVAGALLRMSVLERRLHAPVSPVVAPVAHEPLAGAAAA